MMLELAKELTKQVSEENEGSDGDESLGAASCEQLL